MRFYERFSHCPCCGVKYRQRDLDAVEARFVCEHCGDHFYQNSIPSSTAVIPARERWSEVLLLTRATEPGQGKLALPGGILRYGEIPSEGAKREVREETGLDVTIEKMLCVTPVDYVYRGMHVSVLELAYLTQPANQEAVCTPEATSVGYYEISDLLREPSRLAFMEQRRVLEEYGVLADQVMLKGLDHALSL